MDELTSNLNTRSQLSSLKDEINELQRKKDSQEGNY